MAARMADPSGGSTRLRTVCLHGPESTGKTTLARQLADRFRAVMVPEFGRLYCEMFGNDCDLEDLRAIRRGHDLLAAAGRRKATKLLILDTDAVMTAVWSDILLGSRPADLDTVGDAADFYLLCDIDLPFKADSIRYFPEPSARQTMFEKTKAELRRRHLPFALVRGEGDARIAAAVGAITQRFPELAVP
jgi:HTH-type transcriptional regulator, transcriptional repressor of NAD biosynthesis genes